MQAEDPACVVAGKHSGLAQAQSAAGGLLGGLEEKEHVPRQGVQMRPHVFRQGQHHGSVAVVAAGVHFAGVDGGPGQAGALRNGQGVRPPEGDGFGFVRVKEGAYAAGNGGGYPQGRPSSTART